MKFSLLLGSVLLLGTLSLKAQKSVTVVTYSLFSYGGHKSEQVLKLQEGRSHFSIRKKDEELQNAEGMTFYHYFTHRDIYTDLATGKMVYQKLYEGVTPLISTWPLQKFDWKISSETKELLGYKVQKATTKAYYFEYADQSQGEVIVWFTSDIPFPSGPDGYYGLPGLILELSYTQGTDRFVVKSVDTRTDQQSIAIPTDGLAVSKEQMVFPRDYPIEKKKLSEYNKKWLKEHQKKSKEDK